MKESDSTEDSKTNPSNKHEMKDEEEEDKVENNNIPKNGASSSNSTVEENGKKAVSGSSSVRPYIRSKNPRLRWTRNLHLCFIQAIERLGGQDRATPKLVLQLMNVKGLSISHVKSHLQMYRSQKFDKPNHVLGQGLLSNDGDQDQHIYNLSQLPMLQGFIQRPTSSLRYADEWSRHGNLIYSQFPFNVGGVSFDRTRQVLYGSWRTQIRRRSMEPNEMQDRGRDQVSTDHFHSFLSHNKNLEETRALKRKVPDSDNGNLDLNLSLKMTRNEELEKHVEDEEGDSSLSLSLFSSSTSINSSRLKRSDHGSRKLARGASTLDLTL